MSKCKTVTLRKRKIKNGTQYSLCLDYYPGYRDNTTMKVITREALGIYIFAKPANQQERDFNARMMKKAEILRNRRYEAIFNENNGFFDKARMKGDFLAYFKELAERKNIKWQHVYKHFERFVNGKCTFEEVDVDLCRKFMEYLLNAPQSIHTNQKLHVNSAAGYWSAFRAVLHTAYRDRKIKALYGTVVWKQALLGIIPSIRIGEWESMRISPIIRMSCWIWLGSMRL